MGGPAQQNEKLHHYHRMATCATEFLAISLHFLSTLHINITPLGTSLFAAYSLATATYLRFSLVQLKKDN
ncbi:MAG: hypothetical protein CXR31_00325 [Geobacter sp.]|nr:MAG: hypothetical protein CXR31_00325 [Geobacter sp.]